MVEPAKKIKIMALVPTMRTGGAERVISLLLQHLDRATYEPELTIVYEREIAYEIPGDVPIVVLDREPDPPNGALQFSLPSDLQERFAASSAWMGGIAAKLAVVVNRRQPDIIISSPMWASIIASVSRQAFPSSVCLINRVDAPPSVSLAQTELQDLFAYFMREHFNDAERIIAVSQAVGRDLVDNFCVDAERIQVVHNPIDIERIERLAAEPVEDVAFADDVPVVLFVGRIERVKGLEYLVRAMAQVVAERPARLVLVGDGSRMGYLTALSKHLGIEQHIHFLGRHANPFRFMKRATVFVLPSLSEGMPNVLLEAMACGCPVIASDIEGGIAREVTKDGECGLVVPRADVAALTSALMTMLGDDELRARLSEAGLVRAREFDLPGIIRANQDLIDSVASVARATVVDAERPSVPAVAPRAKPRSEAGARLRFLLSPAGLGTLWARFGRRIASIGTSSVRRTIRKSVAQDDGRVRVAVVVPSLDDAYTGPGTECIIRGLDRSQFSVALVSVDRNARQHESGLDIEELSLSSVSIPGKVPDGLEPDIAGRYHDRIARMAGSARQLAKVLNDFRADVVLSRGFYASLLVALAKDSGALDAMTVVNMQRRAHEFADASFGGDLYMSLMRRFLRNADAVIASDAAVSHDLIEKLGVPQALVRVLPEPVDMDAARAHVHRQEIDHPWAAEGTPFFVCVDQPGPASGLRYLVDALARARMQEPVRCLIACDPNRRGEVRELATTLGVGDAVDFFDPAADAGLLLERATAAIHCAAEPVQGLPETVVRAVTCGCAVIASRSSDVLLEFLGTGDRGLLVPMKEAQPIADAMLQLVWDGEAREAMVARSVVYAERVSNNVIVPQFAELMRTCTEQRREGQPRP